MPTWLYNTILTVFPSHCLFVCLWKNIVMKKCFALLKIYEITAHFSVTFFFDSNLFCRQSYRGTTFCPSRNWEKSIALEKD